MTHPMKFAREVLRGASTAHEPPRVFYLASTPSARTENPHPLNADLKNSAQLVVYINSHHISRQLSNESYGREAKVKSLSDKRKKD